ncbi:transcription antitermination factor NusB [Paraglaciecola chathamensis]|uniref:Transcription antitermination protein NusB n=3 Tax=Paraglaciecola chathamensis TaxID=368405 RepID=A0A8H9IDV5_9ALTE|nr:MULTISPECIES: transcription antitermination factor NusB [Paraglaciecola]AEE24019.1 NusB antitermination factor [Glaciecola sp. 4H-3-7+YE-5]MBN25414.1 N utilization substance protein B [Alteromonadaceae bacterium]MBU3016738.1 transcription antitermination factor NusB [Paraglaciecola agarilytica]MDO6558404.1 transcription antitermination factor NusB [Paraglaciecola chathamensis]MDO6840441.1 transcription antitermination factor NusB [Paraglaciecola chathamensis]
MKPAARRKARELAVQAVYSWQMSKNPLDQVELSIVTSNNMQDVDTEYFLELLRAVVRKTAELDAKIKPYLGRLPEELDPVENAILRLATYELVERIDVPYKVVINEAIELAKSFGAEESHKFINGVLDKAIKTLRKHELS